jgi:hypothetical protein
VPEEARWTATDSIAEVLGSGEDSF